MVKRPRPAWSWLFLTVACPGVGCGLVPKSQLEECRKACRSLQAETAQLKDSNLGLRDNNRDLAQRAVDDADRIRTLEDATGRYEQDIRAYQEERERLVEAFERIRGQVQARVETVPKSLLARFEAFARSHPGCEFDPKTAVVTFPVDLLFEPGTDTPKAGAHALLEEYAQILAVPEVDDLELMVVGRAVDSSIRRVAIDDRSPADGRLGLDRAMRVRELIGDRGGPLATRIGVAGRDASEPGDHSIEIHLRRRPKTPTDPEAGRPGS